MYDMYFLNNTDFYFRILIEYNKAQKRLKFHFYITYHYMSVYNSSILNTQPLELVDQSIGKTVQVITNYGIEYKGTLNGCNS